MQFRTQSFPFCPVDVANEEVGVGKLHPLTISIQQCADWYWGVKIWRAQIDITWGSFSLDLQLSDGGAPGTIPETEHDLICLPLLGWTTFAAEGAEERVELGLWMFSDQGAPSGSVPTPGDFTTDSLRRTEAGLYYPQFLLQVLAVAEGIGSSSMSTWYDGIIGARPSSLIIDGHVLQTFGVDGVGSEMEVTLAPQEWWPYSPESDASLPIYDITTGERIRSNTVSD